MPSAPTEPSTNVDAQSGGSPGTPRPYAVVDLDGVVADVRHRLHHLERRPKDWRGFFAAATDDPLLPEGAAVVARLAEDHDVVYLTGRPEHCRHDTLRWLRDHDLPETTLYMRASGDFRPSRIAKVERLRALAAQREVAVLVDDDDLVVAAACKAGFAVLHADWMPDTDGLREAQEQEGRT